MKATSIIVSGIALAAVLGGCIGTSPEEAERNALGDYGDGNEEHRPGQPCLVCHRDGYSPGHAEFVLAGTVYLHASDALASDRGVEGVAIDITDAAGLSFTALTNRVGTFMVQAGGVSEPQQGGRGRFRIPRAPEFPITAVVRYRGVEKPMQTVSWREGSCAGCHQLDGAGAESVGPIYILEEGETF